MPADRIQVACLTALMIAWIIAGLAWRPEPMDACAPETQINFMEARRG